MSESDFDTVVKRRQRPRHIQEINTNGLLLRFEQIGKYIEESLRQRRQYNGKIDFIGFDPVNAMEIFGVMDIGGADIERFGEVQIFSKIEIDIFLDKLLEDFNGVLPPIGLTFVVPAISLNGLMENEENFENPGLFRGASFANKEETRFCAIILPLACNPIYKGKNFMAQRKLARERQQEILTAVEISYCLLSFKELFGRFHPYIPEFLSTSSEMEVVENGGRLDKKVVLVGDNCSQWAHSHGNKPGIRFSTSNGEAAMHIGAAVALVKVFTEDDVAKC